MSPEQAKGRPADKRSDVWAFGAVLHEMLSGQRTFKGDDIADTLAAVVAPGRRLDRAPCAGTARDRWDKARIVVQSITSGEPKTLIEGGSDAR